jgi:hypothetical protein
MRKSCKECPYKVKSEHNKKFPEYVDKMFNSGVTKTKKHTCHMMGNVWSEPTEKTVCIGSIENESCL